MEQVFVKPGEGRRLRDCTGRVIPPEGALVALDSYMQRRLNDGDAVLSTDDSTEETGGNTGRRNRKQ